MNDDIRPPMRARETSLQPTPTPEANAETIPKPQTAASDEFVTPEVAAENDQQTVPVFTPKSFDPPEVVEPIQTPGGWKKKLAAHWSPKPSKRATAIALGIFVLLSGGAVSGTLLLKKPTPVPVVKKTVVKRVAPKPVVPTVVPSTLSGLPVDPSVNTRPVTGVMIENSQPARPQSGLKDAGVVFEAIAEGGITRFLALYQDTQPTNVGPVRSARPYYEQWALGFDAGYAHVGGSPEALQDIKDWGVRDLDQFYNSGPYHRISSREAPHNMYTGIDVLSQLEASKGYATSTYTGFARKSQEEAAKIPTAKSIRMAISGPVYNVQYDYDTTTNSYKRTEGGAPHLDADSGAQLSPKVVVALVMPYALEADGYHSSYNTLGSGQAYIFQDGNVTTGQWTKADAKSQFTFTDASGKVIKLNPGQTWITAVGTAGAVTYGS